MATVTTVTPTTTVREHRPGVSQRNQRSNLAGEIDLAAVEGWSFLASFVVGGLDLTYNSGGPTVDIGSGRVARQATTTQDLIAIDAESGVSLASSSDNYIYFTGDDTYEIRDQDNPPSGDALLIGFINTTNDTVSQDTRGRNPLSQFVGSEFTVLYEQTKTVANNTIETYATGVDDPTRQVAAFAWPADGTSPSTDFAQVVQGAVSNNVTNYDVSSNWDNSANEWDIEIFLPNLGPIDMRLHLVEFDFRSDGGGGGGGGSGDGSSGPTDDYAHAISSSGTFSVLQPTTDRSVSVTDGFIGDAADPANALVHDPSNSRLFGAGESNGKIREYSDTANSKQFFPAAQSFDPGSGVEEAQSITYDPANDNVVATLLEDSFVDTQLLSLNASDLSKNWDVADLSSTQQAYCDVDDSGTIYAVDGSGTIFKYDSSGTQQDTTTTTDTPNSVAVLTDGSIAVGFNEGPVKQYDSSLTEQWSTSIDVSFSYGVAGLADAAIAAAGDSGVAVLDNSGSITWERSTARTQSLIGTTPQNRVYTIYHTSSASDAIFCYDASDGSIVYTHQFNPSSLLFSVGRTVVAPRSGAFPGKY